MSARNWKSARSGRVGLAALLMGSTAIAVPAAILSGLVLDGLMSTSAAAQDYTSGALSGTVSDDAGKPVTGASVKLTSQARGQTISLSTNGAGQVHLTGLTPGRYGVSINAPGFNVLTDTVTVTVSQEAVFRFSLQKAGAVQEVVVTGSRTRQDFSKTTTGVTVDLETLVAEEPIARSITAVTLLAPSVVKGVSGFGDTPSIGGGSVAENAYYINGLNITNPDTYIGGSKVPFDFYKTVDVKTGGYAAEFGRATGGVVNAVTKSGSNDLMVGIHGNFALKDLRNKPHDLSFSGGYVNPGSLSTIDSKQVTLEASGPIIKDHLFLYGLVQTNDNTSSAASGTAGSYDRYHTKDPFYGLKLDGYLTPTQHFELTYFDTTTTQTDSNSKYNNATQAIGSFVGNQLTKTGGTNWVSKYTGRVNDALTISAAYGENNDAGDVSPANASAYRVQAYTNGSYATISQGQPFSGASLDDTKRKFYRLDGDLNFDAYGRHHVRFGLDHEDLSETKITSLVGPLPIFYRFGTSGLRITYEKLGGNISAVDQAYYIQDSWDVTPNLNIQIGARNDGFQQSNLSGQKYLDLKDNWAPRIGFSWDPTGTSQFKIFGNYGRYYIPPAMNLGFRGRDLYFLEYFYAPDGTTGYANGAITSSWTLDPVTGLPTAIGKARTNLAGAGYGSTCPADFSTAPGHPVNGASACAIYGGGVQDPALAKLAVGTRATYEDEFILGGNYKINDLWSVGVTATYRNLGDVSEDTDFAPLLYNHFNCDNVSSAQCDFYGNNSAYYIWNPGSKTLTVNDWYAATLGKTQAVTLTGLTFPKPVREYKAVTVDFKRGFDGKWSAQGSVTFGRSYGNYEGTVKSDAGNGAQSDAGSTQDFDYLGLTDNSKGYLPNNHAVQAKLWGSYAILPDLIVGANASIISPMKGSCEGIHPTDPNASAYGASSFYCGGKPAPRGTGWQSDWQNNLDLSVRYTLPQRFMPAGKFVVRGDIFNLFNSQAILQRYAQGDLGPSVSDGADPNYKTPTAYQPPRYVRIGFDWTY